MITLDELRRICPATKVSRLSLFLDHLNEAMREFDIDNPVREGMFLAQLAHESGGFNYVRELASGEAYDVGEKAKRLGNTPEDDGDGERYKGRGLIQITGTNNYKECGVALGADFISQPELLESPCYATRSAAWFWKIHGCNELADKGDFLHITKKINGGTTGYQSRLDYLDLIKQILV